MNFEFYRYLDCNSIVPESHAALSVFEEAVTIAVKKEDAEVSSVQMKTQWFIYAGAHLLSL